MTESVTPPLNRRQLAKRRTAENVLRAARGGFEVQGYEKATIRSIAKAAGMSTGAVFANYQDKAELYAAAFGHPPISPEIGRAALLALRALTVDLDGENGTQDAVDQLAAIDRLRAHAHSVLELAKFPPLPDGQPDPEETALVDVMQWALETGRPGESTTAGAGFVHHAQGQDGERIDVTPVGG